MLFADVLLSNPITQMLFLNIFLILYNMIYKFQTMKTKFNLLVCQNLLSAISFQLGQKSHRKLWNNNISGVTFAFSSSTQNHTFTPLQSFHHLMLPFRDPDLDLQISQFYMQRNFISEEMQTSKTLKL